MGACVCVGVNVRASMYIVAICIVHVAADRHKMICSRTASTLAICIISIVDIHQGVPYNLLPSM